MSRPPNAGLIRYITILDGLFTSKYAKKKSRADFYALAAVVGLEKATSYSQDKFRGRYQLRKEGKTAQLSLTKIPKTAFLVHWETLMIRYHFSLGNLALTPGKWLLYLEHIH